MRLGEAAGIGQQQLGREAAPLTGTEYLSEIPSAQ